MKKATAAATDTSRKPTRVRRRETAKPRVERILVGVRIEPRLVKVMKALAELHNCALGELVEKVFWHSMEGENAFGDKGKLSAETKRQIRSLKEVYGVNYDISDLAKSKGND